MNKDDQLFSAAVKVLFASLETIVNSPSPWKDKAEKIVSSADTTEKTNLEEFTSWFKDVEIT